MGSSSSSLSTGDQEIIASWVIGAVTLAYNHFFMPCSLLECFSGVKNSMSGADGYKSKHMMHLIAGSIGALASIGMIATYFIVADTKGDTIPPACKGMYNAGKYFGVMSHAIVIVLLFMPKKENKMLCYGLLTGWLASMSIATGLIVSSSSPDSACAKGSVSA